LISAASPPALFHAGSARGLHPSELSPLKQPAHLSMTRALLTFARSRLDRRTARTPLLNIRFSTTPLQRPRHCDLHRRRPKPPTPSDRRSPAPRLPPRTKARGLHHDRLRPAHHRAALPGPKPRCCNPPVHRRAAFPGPKPRSSNPTVRRCAAFPGPKPRSSNPPARLAAASPLQRHCAPRRKGNTASRTFHGSTLALANPWSRPEGRHPRSAGRRLHRLPESRQLPRPLGRLQPAPPKGHAPPRSKLTLRPVVRQDRLPLMSTSSFCPGQHSDLTQKQVRLQGFNPLESPLSPRRLLQQPGARCSPGFSAPAGFFSLGALSPCFHELSSHDLGSTACPIKTLRKGNHHASRFTWPPEFQSAPGIAALSWARSEERPRSRPATPHGVSHLIGSLPGSGADAALAYRFTSEAARCLHRAAPPLRALSTP
jgi:hypothetical protein